MNLCTLELIHWAIICVFRRSFIRFWNSPVCQPAVFLTTIFLTTNYLWKYRSICLWFTFFYNDDVIMTSPYVVALFTVWKWTCWWWTVNSQHISLVVLIAKSYRWGSFESPPLSFPLQSEGHQQISLRIGLACQWTDVMCCVWVGFEHE